MDVIAFRAHRPFLRRQVEAVVKVERRAVLVELSANSTSVEEKEIDGFAAGQGGSADASGLEALRPLLFLPGIRLHGTRSHRDPHDHLFLHDERAHLVGLLGDCEAKDRRQEREDESNRHLRQ